MTNDKVKRQVEQVCKSMSAAFHFKFASQASLINKTKYPGCDSK